MNNLELFGQRIKELRKMRKLTQEQLGEMVGVDCKHISSIENGIYFTKMATLEKLAMALSCDISELFSFNHLKNKDDLVAEIYALLKRAPEDKIKILYRLAKDVLK